MSVSDGTATSVGHVPGGRWTFDEAVAYCFDDMLRRSIPLYPDMRQACFELACQYQQPKTAIVDLGASRGEAIAPLVDRFGAFNRFVLVEIADPMVQVLRERFAGLISCGVVEVRQDDLRHEFPPVRASVVLSVLTLQFVPIEYRQRVVSRAYDALEPGGALILVEKVLGATAMLTETLSRQYHALKAANGYSTEEIAAKATSLEGVLVPVTARWNEELLHAAGFAHVDCFWRWMNFAGWLAVK